MGDVSRSAHAAAANSPFEKGQTLINTPTEKLGETRNLGKYPYPNCDPRVEEVVDRSLPLMELNGKDTQVVKVRPLLADGLKRDADLTWGAAGC